MFAIDRPCFVRLESALIGSPSNHFLCLIAADFDRAADGEIIEVAQSLLEAGASYFVCWGPDCQRAHDLIDDLTLLVASPALEDSIIMTTWHADESLLEALFFLLCAAWPDLCYQDTTGCIVAVSVGGGDVATKIHEALAGPETLVAKMDAS